MLARSILRGGRGDTMIEVLFAITIFSLVAVGGLAIMNQGTATAERALEITLVRNEIDAQAETLRFLNTSYIAAYTPGINPGAGTPAGEWQTMEDDIKATGAVAASAFGVTNGNQCPTAPAGSFILNTKSARFVSGGAIMSGAKTFAQVSYDAGGQVTSADGIWIEAVRSQTSMDAYQRNSGYIDFHIRACWDSPGQAQPVTLGTIVRLYAPR